MSQSGEPYVGSATVVLCLLSLLLSGGCAQGDLEGPSGTSPADGGPSDGSAVDGAARATRADGSGCVDGQTRACGTSEGVCEEGTEICRGGSWGPCRNAVESSTETCNRKDDDCDGSIDEGGVCGPCTPGKQRECGDDTGTCRAGTQTCGDDEKWGPCEGAEGPSEEVCDGKDNDCNGEIDDLKRECGKNKGRCRKGTQSCSGGTWGPCTGGRSEQSEQCNGLDDDCDGKTDEQIPWEGNACDTGDEGVCSNGTFACNQGVRQCEQTTSRSSEACNGKDDDCDGDVDEEIVPDRNVSCGKGVCASTGREVCRNGNIVSTCTPGASSNETCDNEDDDCDGSVDEGLFRSCNEQDGVCSGSKRPCTSGAYPSECKPRHYGNDYEEEESSCGDGKDNNCDGDVDCEDYDCDDKQCHGPGTECDPIGDECEETACQDGKDNDNDGQTDCKDSDCYYCSGSGAECKSGGECVETDCDDGIDNDEDGKEDCGDKECAKTPCGGQCSCAAGVSIPKYCINGKCQCPQGCN